MANPAAKPRKRRSQAEARDAILDAAEAILAAQGLEQVLLKPVAQAAGITHSGVLHHFGSRAGLLEALFQRASERMRGEMLDRLTGVAPDAGMDELVDVVLSVYERGADPSRAPILAWLIANGGDALPAREAFGLASIAERVHAARLRVAPAASAADTQFRVELFVLAMFGDLMVGSSTRLRLSGRDSVRRRREFRERLVRLLLEGAR